MQTQELIGGTDIRDGEGPAVEPFTRHVVFCFCLFVFWKKACLLRGIKKKKKKRARNY